jgi:UDP-N-acetylenolpyruvoylglucosamine reductase
MDASGKELLYPVTECRYAYRHSLFKKPHMNHLIVTSVTFALSKIPAYNLSYGSIQEELTNAVKHLACRVCATPSLTSVAANCPILP